jgi:hypothetical protein
VASFHRLTELHSSIIHDESAVLRHTPSRNSPYRAPPSLSTMAGGKKGESTKRAAGMAKKAEVAAEKAAAEAARQEAAEQQKWQTGAKSSAKK